MVEADSVVYKYTREYFGLVATNGVHLTDARGVRTQSSTSNMFLADVGHIPIKYYYVAHHCFSYLSR